MVNRSAPARKPRCRPSAHDRSFRHRKRHSIGARPDTCSAESRTRHCPGAGPSTAELLSYVLGRSQQVLIRPRQSGDVSAPFPMSLTAGGERPVSSLRPGFDRPLAILVVLRAGSRRQAGRLNSERRSSGVSDPIVFLKAVSEWRRGRSMVDLVEQAKSGENPQGSGNRVLLLPQHMVITSHRRLPSVLALPLRKADADWSGMRSPSEFP